MNFFNIIFSVIYSAIVGRSGLSSYLAPYLNGLVDVLCLLSKYLHFGFIKISCTLKAHHLV